MTLSASCIALNSEIPQSNGSQWVHLLPAGRFHGRDGRGPYEASNLPAIVLASRDRAGSRQMPIDYNHGTDLAARIGAEAPAAGWIVGLQARADGIWGLVEWTPRAAVQLRDREYRYISPVFLHDPSGKVSHILRASLVNDPNLDELTALASAQEHTMHDTLAELRLALDLEETADGTAILAAVEALKTTAHGALPDPAQYVPVGLLQKAVAEVQSLRQGISLQAATDHVDGVIRAGRILPFMREWAIALCQTNKPSFDTFMDGVGPGFSHLLNASGAAVAPPSSLHAQADGLDKEIAERMGFDANEFAAFRGRQETRR